MSTINPNAVVDRTAKITRSVLYENVYVGKNSVLDGCIICENAKIGSDCLIPRGCIVGADSIIEDGAVFGDGIIVTNGVYIGKGVSVMKNVYSNEVKTRLFDSDLGVGGIYGANFDISDAVYLGQSLCTQQKKGERAKIGVMCGDNGFSRILAGVTIGGVRFGGGDCIDLGDGFLSLCAFSAREFLLDYAIFVDVDQEFDIAISVFDSEGLLLSREGQRRLERVFFRRGEAQSYPRDAETLEESQNPKSVYASALTALVKELAGFKLSIKTTNSPSEILREALNKCGADVKTNTDGDIFDLSDNGLYLSAVTKSGKKVSFWHFLCLALGESVKNGKSIVAIPQYAPLSLVRYLESFGAKIEYYSDSETDNRKLIGSQNRLFDAGMLAMICLNILHRRSKDLDQMLAELPAFYIKEINVAVDEDKKAERARGLREECSDTAHGLAFVYGNGRVCVSASNGNFFKLFGTRKRTSTEFY
ncbi:MAG: hypothetical protein RR246_01335, partial [Clostridia bacterium]